MVEILDTPVEIKCQKSLLIPCGLKKLFKVRVKIFGFKKFFLKTVSFIENIVQIKIVDHKIIYKNVPHTFFSKIITIPKEFLWNFGTLFLQM